MKKLIFISLFLLPLAIFGQDSIKMSDLPKVTSLDSNDLFLILDDETNTRGVFWYYMAQSGFPVDVRTRGPGIVLTESFWIGEDAGLNNTAGAFYNVGIGTRSQYGLTSGTGNSTYGYNSGFSLTTGYGNVFAGLQSGYAIDTSGFCVAIGYQPMYSSTGFRNIAIGYQSAYNLEGSYNVFAGWKAGYTGTTADYNVGIGPESLMALTTGDYNTGIGFRSLDSLTTSTYVTAYGAYSGQSHTTGITGVSYFGSYSGQYMTGTGNSGFGYQSLKGVYGSSGTYNSGFGSGVMVDITSGNYNCAFGSSALANITTGGENIAIGVNALNTITTQGLNVAIGDDAMQDGTPTNSVAVGHSAGKVSTSSGSVFIGLQAGVFNTSGVNTLIGYQALSANSTGTRNTILGYQTQRGGSCSDNTIMGYQAATNGNGDKNTILGSYAGYAQTTADGVIKLGHKAGYNDNTDSTLWIDINPVDTLIWGDFANDSVVINGDLYVTGDHNLGSSSLLTDDADTAKLNGHYLMVGEGLESSIYNTGAASETRLKWRYNYGGSETTYTAGSIRSGGVISWRLNPSTVLTGYAIEVETDSTVNMSADLAVAGHITGKTRVTLDTRNAITLTADSCMNDVRINNEAEVKDYSLPTAAAGLCIMFYDKGGAVITVDAASGDEICLNGTDLTAGYAIDSPGAAGDFIVLTAIDDTHWITTGRSGVWIDGGAD